MTVLNAHYIADYVGAFGVCLVIIPYIEILIYYIDVKMLGLSAD